VQNESIDVKGYILSSIELIDPGIKNAVRVTAVRTSSGLSKSTVAAKKSVNPK
jgi:ribosome-binding factor A